METVPTFGEMAGGTRDNFEMSSKKARGPFGTRICPSMLETSLKTDWRASGPWRCPRVMSTLATFQTGLGTSCCESTDISMTQCTNRFGHGNLTRRNGDFYTGIWDDNAGNGTVTYTDGTIYVGEWNKDKRHGFGKKSVKTKRKKTSFKKL